MSVLETTPRNAVDDRSDEVTEEVSESVSSLVESFADALPRVTVALGVLLVGYLGSRLLRVALRRSLRRNRSESFALVISKFSGWVLLSFFVLAASAVAFPSVQPVDLLAGLGFFSIAVGFAFQDVLENTLSGVLLLFRQPFATGDQIEVDERIGTVEGITIRETRVRTFDGDLLVIPNRDVYQNVIRVQTERPEHRQRFVVGIAYDGDPTDACATVAEAVGDVPGVWADPPVEVLVSSLGTSTVDLEVRFWGAARQLDAQRLLSAAMIETKRSLERTGVEMPADIVVLQATPSFKAAVQGDREPTPGGGLAAPAAADGDGEGPARRGGRAGPRR